ncbi:unnamed protein product [Caenorhabditis angaria]|uniref:Uncharacterized protein n=1 Tax=Caenorhabditis angaria TaxID=860376 RepID=A0A9P1N6Q2_9PELO|nr:unnamed protein product [Caenorhabditis angaria]
MVCANPLALNSASFQWYSYTNALIYILVFLIYLSVWILLKKSEKSNSNTKLRMVFRSISVTVGFVLMGWAITTTANSLSYTISADVATIQLIQEYSGIAVNIAAASNVFVFYAINQEYREAIRAIFGFSGSNPKILAQEPSTTHQHQHLQRRMMCRLICEHFLREKK